MSSVGNKPFTSYENTLHLCLRITRLEVIISSRLGPCVESAVNMNEPAHDNMSASHGRCENGKRTKNVSGKGVVYQNNALNINLMYSCCLLHICSSNSAAIVKRQSFGKVE